MWPLGFGNFSDRVNGMLQKKQAMTGDDYPQNLQAPGQAVMNVNRFAGGADDLYDASPQPIGTQMAARVASSPPPMPARPMANSGASGIPMQPGQMQHQMGMQPRALPQMPQANMQQLPQAAPMQMPMGDSGRVAPPFWSTPQGAQYQEQQQREGMRKVLMDRVMAGMQPTQTGAQTVDQRLQQKPLGVGGRLKEGVLGFLQGFGRGGILGGLGGAIGGATGDNYREREGRKIDQENALTRQQSQDAAGLLGRLDTDDYRDAQIDLRQQAQQAQLAKIQQQGALNSQRGKLLDAQAALANARTTNLRDLYPHQEDMQAQKYDFIGAMQNQIGQRNKDLETTKQKDRLELEDKRVAGRKEVQAAPKSKAGGGAASSGGRSGGKGGAGSGKVTARDIAAEAASQLEGPVKSNAKAQWEKDNGYLPGQADRQFEKVWHGNDKQTGLSKKYTSEAQQRAKLLVSDRAKSASKQVEEEKKKPPQKPKPGFGRGFGLYIGE